MDKLRMMSMDNVQMNVEKIQKLFPNAVTEVLRDGKPTLAIDFDVLKQELSVELIDDKEERYQMTWPDKKKSILLANTPISATLRPCKEESVNNLSFLVARIMPKYKDEDKYTVYEKDYIDKNGDVRTVKEHTSWDRKEFNSDNAMLEFKNLGFSNQLFPFPKSSALIKHIAYLADVEDGYILDFFSGSATTAHAVMQLNAEDGGNRKFIMVQLPEKCDEKSEAFKAGYDNICEIGKERIRRAGKKIKEENPLTTQDLDIGFRVLKLDSSNMKDVYYKPEDYSQGFLESLEDNIKADRTPLDLLFQVMLDLGKPLSAKIEEKDIAGKHVFVVDDNDLVACFDSNVTEDVVKTIAQLKPLYAVFRDRGLSSDSVGANFDQIFATYSPNTTRKVL